MRLWKAAVQNWTFVFLFFLLMKGPQTFCSSSKAAEAGSAGFILYNRRPLCSRFSSTPCYIFSFWHQDIWPTLEWVLQTLKLEVMARNDSYFQPSSVIGKLFPFCSSGLVRNNWLCSLSWIMMCLIYCSLCSFEGKKSFGLEFCARLGNPDPSRGRKEFKTSLYGEL